jgi:hypothetical protein
MVAAGRQKWLQEGNTLLFELVEGPWRSGGGKRRREAEVAKELRGGENQMDFAISSMPRDG